jgi:hypothetical protein
MAHHRHLTRLRLSILLVALAAAGSHTAHAQGSPGQPADRGISGRVVEAGTGRAVPRASVTLLNELGRHVAGVTADAQGGFHLPVPTPGRYQLRADRVGYQRSTSELITVVPSDTVRVELRMSTDAVVLAPLTVVASSSSVTRSSRMAAFQWRQRHHPSGRFVGPERIERIRPFNASDVLQQVPFVQITGNGLNRYPTMRGRFGDRCSPTIYVDGSRMPAPEGGADARARTEPRLIPFARSFPAASDGQGDTGGGVALDQMVSGPDIAAVEVYDRPFEAPVEFTPASTQINCGVIVIWTRRPRKDAAEDEWSTGDAPAP